MSYTIEVQQIPSIGVANNIQSHIHHIDVDDSKFIPTISP